RARSRGPRKRGRTGATEDMVWGGEVPSSGGAAPDGDPRRDVVRRAHPAPLWAGASRRRKHTRLARRSQRPRRARAGPPRAGEMKDAQELIRHILFLEGMPNLQRLNSVRAGETVEEDLRLDLELELQVLGLQTEAVTHCAQVEDYGTRGMLEKMVADEEEQV